MQRFTVVAFKTTVLPLEFLETTTPVSGTCRLQIVDRRLQIDPKSQSGIELTVLKWVLSLKCFK